MDTYHQFINAIKTPVTKYKFHFIIAIVAILAVSTVAFSYFWSESQKNENLIREDNSTQEKVESDQNQATYKESAWQKGCESDTRVQMSHLPMNINDVGMIIPLGMVVGGHVTPIDHLYFSPIVFNSPRDQYPVFAMADGYIIEIGTREVVVGTGQQRPIEYRIIMQHSCQTVSYFDLVTSLDESILSYVPDIDTIKYASNIRIPIKAGQEIGRIGGQTLDTAIYNMDLELSGFITPAMYDSEFWKIHTDDFLEYFPTNLQEQMNEINLRKYEPYSGKIDYDIPEKLVGSWFEKGTNGYGGISGEGNHAYWIGHLHIGYDGIKPDNVWISLGDFDGTAQHFYVKGNSPNPTDVDVSNGIVKYELIQPANFMSVEQVKNYVRTEGIVLGVILLQVLPDEELKVEVFPNKTADSINEFTNNFKIYER